MPPQLLFDYRTLDFSKPMYDIEAIRRLNPQRNQMEQLTAVVYVDPTQHLLVGYKDVTDEEFWVSGHMPGYPLMPGVIMCEAVAQLAAFYSQRYKIVGGDFVGFGGMREVIFRAPVYPPARFIIVARAFDIRMNRRASFHFQGLVNDKVVVHGSMEGVPIFREQQRPSRLHKPG
jgi:3-hydroxyacyl-[acyl-carrier-protein] dehydratase